jgi:hypothetical protein
MENNNGDINAKQQFRLQDAVCKPEVSDKDVKEDVNKEELHYVVLGELVKLLNESVCDKKLSITKFRMRFNTFAYLSKYVHSMPLDVVTDCHIQRKSHIYGYWCTIPIVIDSTIGEDFVITVLKNNKTIITDLRKRHAFDTCRALKFSLDVLRDSIEENDDLRINYMLPVDTLKREDRKKQLSISYKIPGTSEFEKVGELILDSDNELQTLVDGTLGIVRMVRTYRCTTAKKFFEFKKSHKKATCKITKVEGAPKVDLVSFYCFTCKECASVPLVALRMDKDKKTRLLMREVKDGTLMLKNENDSVVKAKVKNKRSMQSKVKAIIK